MTKEALKLALGYVERNCPALVFKEIKEAQAQPEQDEAAIRADERKAIAAWLDGEAGSGRIISCTSAAKAIRERGNTNG